MSKATRRSQKRRTKNNGGQPSELNPPNLQEPNPNPSREELILSLVPYAERWARHFVRRWPFLLCYQDREDYISIATIALIKAIDDYSADPGSPAIERFCFYRVYFEIIKHVKRHVRRLPHLNTYCQRTTTARKAIQDEYPLRIIEGVDCKKVIERSADELSDLGTDILWYHYTLGCTLPEVCELTGADMEQVKQECDVVEYTVSSKTAIFKPAGESSQDERISMH